MKNITSNQQFELSSDIRLPFEPKGQALELREELRKNIRNFKQSSQE